MVVERRPYDEVMTALDACAAMPEGHQVEGLIAGQRLILVRVYGRDDAECERVLVTALTALMSMPLQDRALTVASACMHRPALAERFVPPLIDKLTEELRKTPDETGQRILDAVRSDLEQTRAGASSSKWTEPRPSGGRSGLEQTRAGASSAT